MRCCPTSGARKAIGAANPSIIGAGGPLTVARHETDDYVYPRLIETAGKLGYPHLDDFHGDAMEGFSAPDFTVHRGRRASTSAQFLRPALARPNLTVISNALTTKLLVRAGQGGRPHL